MHSLELLGSFCCIWAQKHFVATIQGEGGTSVNFSYQFGHLTIGSQAGALHCIFSIKRTYRTLPDSMGSVHNKTNPETKWLLKHVEAFIRNYSFPESLLASNHVSIRRCQSSCCKSLRSVTCLSLLVKMGVVWSQFPWMLGYYYILVLCLLHCCHPFFSAQLYYVLKMFQEIALDTRLKIGLTRHWKLFWTIILMQISKLFKITKLESVLQRMHSFSIRVFLPSTTT